MVNYIRKIILEIILEKYYIRNLNELNKTYNGKLY